MDMIGYSDMVRFGDNMKDLSDFREYFVEKYYDEAWLTDARVRYETANPFPHIVIDDFLPPETLDEVLANFSQYNKDNWYKFDGQYELKLASKSEYFIPQFIRHVLHELNSGYVLNWLEKVTNVPGLVADTRLYGGGMHNIERGGKLGVHIDFNIENHTRMHRQLNLLLYLNKDWQDEWGGHLELWNADKTECVQKIAPIFNRCSTSFTNHVTDTRAAVRTETSHQTFLQTAGAQSLQTAHSQSGPHRSTKKCKRRTGSQRSKRSTCNHRKDGRQKARFRQAGVWVGGQRATVCHRQFL